MALVSYLIVPNRRRPPNQSVPHPFLGCSRQTREREQGAARSFQEGRAIGVVIGLSRSRTTLCALAFKSSRTESGEIMATNASSDGAMTDQSPVNKAALHEQRDWLRVTLSSIGDAVITTDREGQVAFLNPVAEVLTGWSLQDAIGQPIANVFRLINEDSRQPVESPSVLAFQENRTVELASHSLLIAKDGTERPIEDSAAPICNDKGEVAGVVLVFRDTTERRNAEQDLVTLWPSVPCNRFLNSLIAGDRRVQPDVFLPSGEIDQNPVLPEGGHLVADRLPWRPVQLGGSLHALSEGWSARRQGTARCSRRCLSASRSFLPSLLLDRSLIDCHCRCRARAAAS